VLASRHNIKRLNEQQQFGTWSPSVEHLVGEVMNSLVTLIWESRAMSWLGAEVAEGVGEVVSKPDVLLDRLGVLYICLTI
jgi:hypothetical protein